MVTLTSEQKTLLQQIVNDKFAAGPFAGMIFNATVQEESQHDPVALQDRIPELIQNALQIRLYMKGLAE